MCLVKVDLNLLIEKEIDNTTMVVLASGQKVEYNQYPKEVSCGKVIGE